MDRVTVEIAGNAYPLCLTVSALSQICAAFGGLDDMVSAIRSDDTGRALDATVDVLGILIREGEERRLMVAQLDGVGDTEKHNVPTAGQLRHYFLPWEASDYRPLVLEAINASLRRSVEVATKNA